MTLSRWILYVVGALVIGGLIYAGFLYEPPPDVTELETRIFRQVGEGDFDGAARTVAELEGLYPKTPRGPLLAGYVAEFRRDLDAVKKHYDRALPLCRTDEQRRDLGVSIADVLRRQSRFEAAEEELGRTVERYGACPKAAELRVLLILAQEGRDPALSALTRVAEDYPGNVRFPRLKRMIEGTTNTAADGRADRGAASPTPSTR